MRQSFATYAAPERYKLPAKAEDRNGATIDIELQESSAPMAQMSAKYAVDMIKTYVPFEKRGFVKPQKDDPTPTDFPQGPQTGPIDLTEEAIFEITNFYFQQVPEFVVPWSEFVYMWKVAPNCYKACQAALYALEKGQDLEGNAIGGFGSPSSEPQQVNTSPVILTSSVDGTTSSPESTQGPDAQTNS